MTTLSFTGMITQRIYNSTTNGTNIPPNPPDTLPNPTNAYQNTVSNNQKIIWKDPSTVPNQFLNITPPELAVAQIFPITKITFSPTVFILTGFQDFLAGCGKGTALLGFQPNPGRESKTVTPVLISSGNGSFNYSNINTSFSNIPVNVMAQGNNSIVYFNIWNTEDELPDCQQPGINFTMDYILNITVEIECFGVNLDSEICVNYCTAPDNLKSELCTKNYAEFCFDTFFTPGATGPTIFANNGENGCYNYFKSYLTVGPGPNPGLDDKIATACSFLQIDEIVPFYQPPPNNIQDICACHLDKEFYQNLQKEINALPGGNTVDLPDVCLFPPCVNPDSFPRVIPGQKACPVAPCINIADIQNNGNIKGGTTINQSCLNTKATIEKYLIILVPVGIIILFVIIVILFLVFRNA